MARRAILVESLLIRAPQGTRARLQRLLRAGDDASQADLLRRLLLRAMDAEEAKVARRKARKPEAG